MRFPWKPRAERKADIESAYREAAVSRKKARVAREIEEDLNRMASENHFAEMIQAAITGRSAGNHRYSGG